MGFATNVNTPMGSVMAASARKSHLNAGTRLSLRKKRTLYQRPIRRSYSRGPLSGSQSMRHSTGSQEKDSPTSSSAVSIAVCVLVWPSRASVSVDGIWRSCATWGEVAIC